jgi:hypothetical protein
MIATGYWNITFCNIWILKVIYISFAFECINNGNVSEKVMDYPLIVGATVFVQNDNKKQF